MRIKLVAPNIPQMVFMANLAGMILSVFMWHNAISQKVIGCLTGGGCETVLMSPYSKIFAVPIAAWGLAFYGVNALITVFRLFDDRPIIRLTNWAMSIAGIFASAYFIYLEVAVIHAFCSWCTVSTFLTIALLILAVIEAKKFGGIKGVINELRSLVKV